MLKEVLARATGNSLAFTKGCNLPALGCMASLGGCLEAPHAGARVLAPVDSKAAAPTQEILVTPLRSLACS